MALTKSILKGRNYTPNLENSRKPLQFFFGCVGDAVEIWL